ncbi:hypothetical protein ASG11_15540 [Sphingomonas sp. Leaf357]|uniref:tyrosine-type recombinase/integrase n=1 Tax=Sphingomonas sp. Leaf357 TaxID=1736350 RepID=UPI0006FA9417|nr:integrase arm-type DNA-binding domain-containing protein [Sphingomonas sp. Leaf357]KQS02423.1 hypothetical protein ASG11_15540 [Sphingomonas sp. Leaf357]
MGKLTALKVKTCGPGRYVDGQGLMLVVKESGSRSWQLRVQANGKRRDIGLGSADHVTLTGARERAVETRKQIRAGEDPVEAKRVSRRILAALPSFEGAAVAVHDERKSDWKNPKHEAQWLSSMKSYAFPAIGSMPIDKVTAGHVRDLLMPIWQSKPETARRVLQRVGIVLDWGHAKGHRPSEAPMRSIRIGLPKQTTQASHFASLPFSQIADLMTKLGDRDTAGRLALRFLILTAARSGEVRGATWAEIDLANELWTIPGSRMKAGRQHVVPLSPAALTVLELAAGLRKGRLGEPIFPGMSDRPLSDMTLTKVLRTAIGGKWTVHGFRSSFRDWVAEETTYPDGVAEMALAHAVPDKVVAAYRRTIFLEKRREMMGVWAATICPTP